MRPTTTPPRTVLVALTGASGLVYGLRLIDCLLRLDCRVWVVYSQAAQIVAAQECDLTLPSRPEAAATALRGWCGHDLGQLEVFGRENWFAPPASGTNPPDAMVVCPCTMGTLASIAAGLSADLLERAADVAIKEGRTLILVPREAPFSVLHLENMLRLARMGAVILPPSPGFYHRPTQLAELVDFVVARVMDQLHLPHGLMPRWGDDTTRDD